METRKRPLAVLLIAWLYIVAGGVGLAYHATDFSKQGISRTEVVLVLLIRLAAVVGGIFLLRGRNWARWLLVIWMAYHVVLSAFHTFGGTFMHAVLLVVVAFFLFTPAARKYFRRQRSPA